MNRHRRLWSWVGMCAALVSAVAMLVALPAIVTRAPSAEAASAADWRPGNIIDDATFYNSNSMGSPEIQAFMERQMRTCASGYTCIKDYRQNTDNRPADRYCDGYAGRANESASTIIDRVARSCGVSQQVLLVLLQKEQGLITDTTPSSTQFSAAMGQGCPDTAPCDTATAGFFYQVYYAARQYEIYRLNPNSFGYQAGRWNNILYHPTNPCGTQRVYIENQATAGLYIYTPYVPNASALSNLYGTGDSCASYGNRNFWRLFTDWFGATQNASGPFGNLEVVQSVPGEFRVSGWAIDPDTSDAIPVHVYIGSAGRAITANVLRPDVGAAYPGKGDRHGFDARIPVQGGGRVDICVHAINVGAGNNTLLGCRSVDSLGGSPVGTVDTFALGASGTINATGWAIDPDTTASIDIHAYVDTTGAVWRANTSRPDVATHYPIYGAGHGYSGALSIPAGDHQVCLHAINVGAGTNTQLHCQLVRMPGTADLGRTAHGSLDDVVVSGNIARISGWAIDPDTASPIAVDVYVGSDSTRLTADALRVDVGVAYPQYGSRHGYEALVSLPPGRSNVCAFAINTRGDNTLLGCRTVASTPVEAGRAPFGSLDAVRYTDGRVIVSGWAIDPDTASSIDVQAIAADGASVTAQANTMRNDVADAYPGYGPEHGYQIAMPGALRGQPVCVYAFNTGQGNHALIGCRLVG